MTRSAVVVALVALLAGCQGSSSSLGPTPYGQPSGGPRGPLMPTLTFAPDARLWGRVLEETPSGPVPLSGVSVYCDACGPFGHTWADTGDGGEYAFTEGLHLAPGVPTPLHVRREGYGDAQRAPGESVRQVIVSGETHFDIWLVRQ
jgi:hypothetical protein